MFEKNSRYCSVATLKQIPLGPLWTRKTGILSVEEGVTQRLKGMDVTGAARIVLSWSHA